MAAAETLRAAKSEIDTPAKWKKRAGEDGPGTPCCAVVAVARFVRYGTQQNSIARRFLGLALPESYKLGGSLYGLRVGSFNDDPETTHADIMALFDRAIKLAEDEYA